MIKRFAYVYRVSFIINVCLIMAAYSLYKYEMKAIRDMINIGGFMLVVGLPVCIFLWTLFIEPVPEGRKSHD